MYPKNKRTDKNKEVKEKSTGLPIEKGDFLAMVIAAFYTLFLPALLILGGLIFLVLLLFGII